MAACTSYSSNDGYGGPYSGAVADATTATVRPPTGIAIGDGRAFSRTYASGELNGSSIQGVFAGPGLAPGSVHVHLRIDQEGQHFWNARLGR